MQPVVNKDMIAAGLVVLEEALAWPDYPYTTEQLVEAMLRNAMKHYVHPEPPSAQSKSKPEGKGKGKYDEGFVYFISDGEEIKIGKANNVKSRLSGLRTSSSRPLECLGVVKGGLRKERELHKRFDALRLTGEWFKDCEEIRAYIASSCKPLADNDNRRRMTDVPPTSVWR